MGGKPSADRVIVTLAERQHGVVSRPQLLAAGVSRRRIDYRIAGGLLRPLHRGVYIIGAAASPLARDVAACLACGPGAVISHRSAAALWGLVPYPTKARPWVTVPSPVRRVHPGIEVRRATIASTDIRHHRGLPVTSPPRTILDLAPALELEQLESAVAEAQYRGLATGGELATQLDRNRGRPGSPALASILDLPDGGQRTRSPAERMMLRTLREEGIEGYELNARIHGYEVDVLWRAERLAVEIDSYAAHSGPVAFERDRMKVATLESHGIMVMPITPRQLRDDRQGAIARLRETLRDRRAAAGRPQRLMSA